MTTTAHDVLAELDRLHEIVNRFGIRRFRSAEKSGDDYTVKAYEAQREADELFQQIDRWACETKTRIAALVEAARPFDLNVNTELSDLHPMRARHSAREYRAFSEALRGIGR